MESRDNSIEKRANQSKQTGLRDDNIYEAGEDDSENEDGGENEQTISLLDSRIRNKENIIKYASKSQLVRFITDPVIAS